MNTTKKGDAFEGKIYHYFRQQIEQNLFWARKECCQVFRQKGYYSNDRKGDIIFDVSIEITFPGEVKYSVLILVECKDTNRRVPVDDIEEFWTKIQQVAGANVKGIVASTNAFQEGAQNFAEAKGFALLRLFDNDSFKYVLNRASSTFIASNLRIPREELRTALHKDNFVSRYYEYCCFVKTMYTCSTNHMIEQLCKNSLENTTQNLLRLRNPVKEAQEVVRFKSKYEIEALTSACLSKIGYKEGIVNLDDVCEMQKRKNNLVVRTDTILPDNVLGTLSFAPLEITVSPTNNQSRERTRFTVAHELGHLFLSHGEYLTREYTVESDFDPEVVSTLISKDIRRMEWQANYFASCLLLPEPAFSKEFFSIAHQLRLHNHGFGLLYVDEQPVNLHNFRIVTSRLKINFRVSRQAIALRLQDLGYLTDARHRFKPLKGLFEQEMSQHAK